MTTIEEAYAAGFAAGIAKAAETAEGEAESCMKVAMVHRPPFAGVDEEVASLHEQAAAVVSQLARRIREIPGLDGAPTVAPRRKPTRRRRALRLD